MSNIPIGIAVANREHCRAANDTIPSKGDWPEKLAEKDDPTSEKAEN